jgi:hypothetical protein
MRISNAEQYPADAITPEPFLNHGTADPATDFATDELDSKPRGSLYVRTTESNVQLFLKVAEAGGAGDWRLIN